MDTSTNIFTPGIYHGKHAGGYAFLACNITTAHAIRRIQERAQVDGEFWIKNALVGDNEDKMRKMMEHVSDKSNIRKALNRALDEQQTIYYACRNLVNGSKWRLGD